MNDTTPNPSRRKSKTPKPKGEVIYIDVPRPPKSAMNPNRPASALIKAQVSHFQHAESARLAPHKRSGIRLEDIRTEADATAYIREITRLLHPQGPKRRARKAAN
jgi:hypothetical protein